MAASTPRFQAPTVEVPSEESSPALNRLLDTLSPRARKLSKIGIAEVQCVLLPCQRINSFPTLARSGPWRCCHAVLGFDRDI